MDLFSNKYKHVVHISKFPPWQDLSIGFSDARVHYFVGKNGSGKTKIFEALLQNHAHLSNKLRRRNKSKQYITSYHIGKYSAIKWGSFIYEDKSERSVDFERTKSVLNTFGQRPLEASSSEVPISEERNEEGDVETFYKKVRSHKHHGERYIGPEMLSMGTKKLYEILNWQIPHTKEKGQPIYIVLEEPENSLHPEMEKKLPELLEEWVRTQITLGFPNVRVLVSTHSPFLIKGIEAVTTPNFHSVYTLPETQDFDKKTSIEPRQLADTILYANHMLGSGITDLLPKKILATENSVSVLLEKVLSNLKLEIPHFIAGRGGFSNHIRRVETVRDLAGMLGKLSTIYPEKYTLNLEYLIICDGEDEKEKIMKELGKGSDEHIKVDVFVLGKKCLEEIYSKPSFTSFITKHYQGKRPWNYQEDIKEYARDVLGIEGHEELGIFKRKIAAHVGAEVKSILELKKNLKPLHSILEKITILEP